jgi:nucleotide-binding universal stress UspA family protein
MSEEEQPVAATNRPVAPEIKKVLVAFDGSEHAMRAFNLGKQLSKTSGSDLVVLNVVELQMPYIAARIPPVDISAALEFAKANAEAKIADLVRQAKDEGINARGEVLDKEASVVKQIIDYADRNGLDLILVGTRGLGGFRKMLLGSVSSGLVSHARCSVLVVH